MISKTYKIPTEAEYIVTPIGGPEDRDTVMVAPAGSSTYSVFTDQEDAQSDAEQGSRAAKAALLYYKEQEEAKWKFGDIVTPDNHPSKPFWFVDSDENRPDVWGGLEDLQNEFGPYRFIGFREER